MKISKNNKADIYYNLHRKCLSIRSREKETRGKVVGYAGCVIIKDPKFVVQKAGNNRVRKEKRKNVHAFVRGKVIQKYKFTMTEKAFMSFVSKMTKARAKFYGVIHYNPYENKSFVSEALKNVNKPSPRLAIINGKTIVGVW